MAVNSTHKKRTTAQPIALFSDTSRDSLQKFIGPLAKKLHRPLEPVVMDKAMDVSRWPLLLVDCRCYAANRIQGWLNTLEQKKLPPVALFNTKPASSHEALLEWPCVRGFFFHNTPQQQIVDGLELMLQGDFWVPRRLLHAYLERNRRPPSNQIKAHDLLTKRERQVLKLLEHGATNAVIATKVNVSEHTVKTHLYNIYRKINVANRIEATNWARQNMPQDS